MKFKIELYNGEPMVSSKNIADEFGREHSHVMGAIREVLGRDEIIESSYINAQNKAQPCLLLNERSALIAMPYIGGTKSKEGQRALVDGYLEYRKPVENLNDLEMIAQTSMANARMALELNEARKQQEVLEEKLAIEIQDKNHMKVAINSELTTVDSRLENLETKSRRGTPSGYINAKGACNKDGRLSRKAFDSTMAAWSVPYTNYTILTEEGVEVPTVGYAFKDVKSAINALVESAERISPEFYTSIYISGKFKINK